MTSPVQLPDGGLAHPQPGPRDAGGCSSRTADGQLKPFLDSAEQATPPATLVGDEPRGVSLGQRRPARRDHDRDDARGPDRPAPRGDARHHARRASSRRPTERRSTTSTRDRSSRSTSRAASRATCAPANGVAVDAREPGAGARSSRSTSSDGVKLFRVAVRRRLGALDPLREPAAARAAPDLGRGASGRTAGSPSPSPRPTRCSAASRCWIRSRPSLERLPSPSTATCSTRPGTATARCSPSASRSAAASGASSAAGERSEVDSIVAVGAALAAARVLRRLDPDVTEDQTPRSWKPSMWCSKPIC